MFTIAAAPGRLHVPQRRPGAVEGAVQVGLDHPVPLLVGQRRQSRSTGSMSRPSMRSGHVGHAASPHLRAVVDDAGVVDQDVEAPVALDDAVDRGVERRRVGDVEQRCLARPPRPPPWPPRRRRGRSRRVGAVGGEAASDRRAETRAGTGDEGDASVHARDRRLSAGEARSPRGDRDVGRRSRVLTVPNVITCVAAVLPPALPLAALRRDEPAAAAWLLGVARGHRLGRRLHRPPLQPGVRARQGPRPDGRPPAVLRRRRRHPHRRQRARVVRRRSSSSARSLVGGTLALLTLLSG